MVECRKTTDCRRKVARPESDKTQSLALAQLTQILERNTVVNMTRRRFAAGAACAAMAIRSQISKGEPTMKETTLAPLPYADDALAPAVSAKTVSFHYGKHHAGYVKTLRFGGHQAPATRQQNLWIPDAIDRFLL